MFFLDKFCCAASRYPNSMHVSDLMLQCEAFNIYNKIKVHCSVCSGTRTHAYKFLWSIQQQNCTKRIKMNSLRVPEIYFIPFFTKKKLPNSALLQTYQSNYLTNLNAWYFANKQSHCTVSEFCYLSDPILSIGVSSGKNFVEFPVKWFLVHNFTWKYGGNMCGCIIPWWSYWKYEFLSMIRNHHN